MFAPSQKSCPRNRSDRFGPIASLLLSFFVSSPALAKSAASELRILKTYPHDAGAFTQGLEMDPHDPRNYVESTGQYGSSTLRVIEVESGKIQRRINLPTTLFGEGISRVGDAWVQLTWRAGVALRYDTKSLASLQKWEYQGEGWGLCYDGQVLWMSDGSSYLSARNPRDFSLLRRIQVRYNDQPLTQLNELECARGSIFANVWHQDWIARIDPSNGKLLERIDASALRKQVGSRAGTLNGIAYRSESDTFLLTGKNWPKLFEVDFARIKAPGAASKPSSPQAKSPTTGTSKGRGCAFFSLQSRGAMGVIIGLGCVCGWGNRRSRRRSTAKRASTN